MIPVAVIVLQVMIPLILIARLFQARRLSVLSSVLFVIGFISYVAATAVAGVWLVLPWYTPLAFLGVAAVGILWRSSDIRTLRWSPDARLGYVELGVAAVFVAAAAALLAQAVGARQMPAEEPAVNLAFPLRGGTYYVANGGESELANAHVGTRDDRAYRGQSYAVDLVRIDARGRRATVFVPTRLSEYVSVGEPVLAPCDGRVLQAENSAPDSTPPARDPVRLAGNFVVLDCAGTQVFLGHLKQGSVGVGTGQVVRAGTRLGAIGNSGGSDEPHLHLHAQRAPALGSTSMFDGAPLPITFYGRPLARNDVVRTAAVPPPTMTESQLLYGQLGSTALALLMLLVSVRWRRAGLVLFAVLFAWAAIVNAKAALTSPADYLGYAALTLSELYRGFILGFFAQHATAIVLTIATAQALIAAALVGGGRWLHVGLAGAIVFFLAIAPLGVGSGLPATVILAMGAGALWREPAKRGAVIEIVSRRPETNRRAA